jgi:hypothetical protein
VVIGDVGGDTIADELGDRLLAPDAFANGRCRYVDTGAKVVQTERVSAPVKVATDAGIITTSVLRGNGRDQPARRD